MCYTLTAFGTTCLVCISVYQHKHNGHPKVPPSDFSLHYLMCVLVWGKVEMELIQWVLWNFDIIIKISTKALCDTLGLKKKGPWAKKNLEADCFLYGWLSGSVGEWIVENSWFLQDNRAKQNWVSTSQSLGTDAWGGWNGVGEELSTPFCGPLPGVRVLQVRGGSAEGIAAVGKPVGLERNL